MATTRLQTGRMLMRLTLVVDPRFSGGTSSAVAREIKALSPHVRLSVCFLQTDMFKGDTVHPAIQSACDAAGVPTIWAKDTISADVIVLHNPSCLKFNKTLNVTLRCDALFLVAHENFLRPAEDPADAREAFDVAHCLDMLRWAATCRRRIVAPISPNNRDTVETWFARQPQRPRWEIDPIDWPNICDFDTLPPVAAPSDRRGRHSRPGFEKFPLRPVLETLFPPTCDAVRILGADSLLLETDRPENWECLPFMSERVDRFLESIDFFVYFTNPCWRESFGRVLAEAVAAGKVVITDPHTAKTFKGGVIGCAPDEVDAIIKGFVQKPKTYAFQVKKAQAALRQFGTDSFLEAHRQRMKSLESTAISPKEAIYDLL